MLTVHLYLHVKVGHQRTLIDDAQCLNHFKDF